MLFGKTKMEFKVGIFVFFGLVILVVFTLSIGGFKTWKAGQLIKFTFNFINGIKVGAPIRFAGVDIGQVKEIKFISTPESANKVEMTGWVKKEVNIPQDSQVWVNTLGLLGEKYIEVMPGKDKQNYLKANQVLSGNDPVAMHEIGLLLKNIADDLDAIILKIKNGEGTLGRFFNDDSIYKEIEELVLDLKKHPWKLFWKTKEKPAKK